MIELGSFMIVWMIVTLLQWTYEFFSDVYSMAREEQNEDAIVKPKFWRHIIIWWGTNCLMIGIFALMSQGVA